MTKHGWKKDLRESIAVATEQAVLDHQVSERNNRRTFNDKIVTLALTQGEERDAERVTAAAEMGAMVLLQHRQDAGKQRRLVNTLVDRMALVIHHPEVLVEAINRITSAADDGDEAARLDRQMLRSRLVAVLDVHEQAKTMDKLASATQKLHGIERVAHGMDRPESEKDKRAVATRQMTDVERNHRMQYLLTKGMSRLPPRGDRGT